MSTLKVDTITKADGTGSLSVPAESGTVVTTASPSLGRRNLIINGAMQVAQRGTSFTGLTNGSNRYTLDRWYWAESGATSTVMTVTQSTDAPDGFASSFKMQTTTAAAAANYLSVRYHVEAQNLQHLAYGTSNAKETTLSFWIKSNKTGTGTVWIYSEDSGRSLTKNYTIDVADTWEYKTITIPGDTSGNIANDNGQGLQLEWAFSVIAAYKTTPQTTWNTYSTTTRGYGNTIEIDTSTDDYVAITGVQLEVGSVATPFEHRSYGEELALCERYYQRIIGFNTATGTDTTAAGAAVMFKTEMRSSPTPSLTAPLQITRFGIADFTQSSASVVIAGSETRVNTLAISLNFANFTSLPTDTCLPVIVTGGILTLSAEL